MRKFRIIKQQRKILFGSVDEYVVQESRILLGDEHWFDLLLNDRIYHKTLEYAESALANSMKPQEPKFEVIKEYEF